MTSQPRFRWFSLTSILLLGAAGASGIQCAPASPAPGNTGAAGAGGSAGGNTGSGGVSPAGSGGISPAGTGGSDPTGTGGAGPGTGGAGPGTGGAGPGTGGAGPGTGGATGTGGAPMMGTFMNYQIHGNWPGLKAAIATKPATLTYTKVAAHTRFLGESCSIADYNKDGMPDISSGRRWFPGPTFTTGNVFRGGHDDLPRNGDSPEITEGVSDDWSDFPFDIDGDGWTDIINIASSDANTKAMPAPMPQTNATGFWYKNPGATAATAMWTPYLVHGDIRHEQHGFVDVDGDGKPEIFGACKGCMPATTKGYYKLGANPMAAWTYVPVTPTFTFPFGGTGWMHGMGFGDVNGDGKPDLIDRNGVYMQPASGAWTYVNKTMYDGNAGLERGGSHMYSFDVDGDVDMDIVSADGAHHWGLSWYEQTTPGQFVKHQFMGTNSAADMAKYGVAFSEPHALQVADMDGDGVPDVITGKMRFAHPVSYGDPDPQGAPVVYVFKTARNKTPAYDATSKVTFEPKLVDNVPGVGRQISVGHANGDGFMDICVGTKVGLFVYLGK